MKNKMEFPQKIKKIYHTIQQFNFWVHTAQKMEIGFLQDI